MSDPDCRQGILQSGCSPLLKNKPGELQIIHFYSRCVVSAIRFRFISIRRVFAGFNGKGNNIVWGSDFQ